MWRILFGAPLERSRGALGQGRSVHQRRQRSGVPDGMIDSVLEPGAPFFEFFDFLIRGEIDLLFNAVDSFVNGVILIEHSAEVLVTGFEQLDGFAVFREFFEDRVMEVCCSHSAYFTVRTI